MKETLFGLYTRFKALIFLTLIVLIGGVTIFISQYMSQQKVTNSLKKALKASEYTNGSTFHVDKNNIGGFTCNDTWDGTLSKPLCSIGTAIAKAQPGDTILVRGGLYPPFVISKSGAIDKYLTIAGFEGERPHVKGGQEPIVLKGTSYVRVKGFEVSAGSNTFWGAGIRVTYNNSTMPMRNVIEDNFVHDNVSTNISGILVENGSFNTIQNNVVANNYLSGIWIVQHANITPNGISGNEIIGNVVYGHKLGGGNSDGIKIEGPGAKRNIIKNNTSYDNADDGFDTWNSSENILIGNKSFNHQGPGDGNGFKLGGTSSGGKNTVVQNIAYNNKLNGFDSNGSGSNVFYHNVAYNNGKHGFEDGWKDSYCTISICQAVFINNIGYNNKASNVSASKFTGTSHNNIWFNDNGSAMAMYEFSLKNSLADFYKASGNRLDNPNAGDLSSLSTNPLFTNATGFDFSLLANSPAIDRGNSQNPANIQAVNIPDIGVFEFGGQQTQTLPSPTQIQTSSPTIQPTLAPTQTPTPVVTSETLPPQVSIISPTAGAIVTDKRMQVSVTANDESGIYQIAIYFDNSSSPAKTCGNTKECSTTWNNPKSGLRTIRAVAVDNSPARNSAETTIVVSKK